MNQSEINPFQELYVTDNPDTKVFVALFSDFPVRNASALFKSGNVVLRGTQGSGKSMLLNLLKPQIRVAYAQASAQFPVPNHFIGAGINLTRSGALDFGQRPLSDDEQRDEALFPLYFADFLNYYIVRDVLASLEVMRDSPEAFQDVVKADSLNAFAVQLAKQDCWFNYLKDSRDFESLCTRIEERIHSYRAFHQFNGDLSPEIERTKTTIGEPIARTAECLKTTGAIRDEIPVLIRIDQVERLYRSDVLRPTLGQQYRRIINKALGMRDSRVSYRIGTRKYAWEDDLRIYGTEDQLEHIRDFRIIDLDDLLRRKEHARSWIFPEFAEDAFRRRLLHAGYGDLDKTDCVRQIFGATPPPEETAKQYAANTAADRVLRFDNTFPPEWKSLLEDTFRTDPFSALLGAAWVRQRINSKRPEGVSGVTSTAGAKPEPWNKPYWKKERIRQCLLQIAARSAQRLKWAGKDQLLALSAGNISIFISLCHEVWDTFLRSEQRKQPRKRHDPLKGGIDRDIQTVGIQTAGTYWYQKITEQPKGDDRQRFIDVLGRAFRSWLVDDLPMSYPGHNGFSLANEDLDTCPAIRRFLADAVDYGDLYDSPHTTKEKDRRQRTKWYLSPILSVFFQIPETHVKEPRYVTVGVVARWLYDAGVVLSGLDYSQLLATEDSEAVSIAQTAKGPVETFVPLFETDSLTGDQ